MQCHITETTLNTSRLLHVHQKAFHETSFRRNATRRWSLALWAAKDSPPPRHVCRRDLAWNGKI